MKTTILVGMAVLAIVTSTDAFAYRHGCQNSICEAHEDRLEEMQRGIDARQGAIDRREAEDRRREAEDERNRILRDQTDAMREQAEAMREQNRILEQAERQRHLDQLFPRPRY